MIAANETRPEFADRFDQQHGPSPDAQVTPAGTTLEDTPSTAAPTDELRRRLFEMIRRSEAVRKAGTG